MSMQKPPPDGRLRSALGARHIMSSISILRADSLADELPVLPLSALTVLERLEYLCASDFRSSFSTWTTWEDQDN